MPFETINGFRIYIEDHGHGDVMVLLHHGFGCTRMWKDIYPVFLDRGYRVVLYDRRGYGRSEKDENFPVDYVSDGFRAGGVRELAALRKAMGLDTFHLVGQCEGGVLAVDYALDYPEHVRSITVSSTQCFSKVSMPDFNREKFPRRFRELDSSLQKKFTRWHGEGYAETFFNLFRVHGGAYGTGFFDLRPLLPSVQCPALVLYPDRSFLFDVEQGVAFYRGLPRGELAVLPKCGHNTYEQRPLAYAREILEFLDRHGDESEADGSSSLTATCIH
ncbi:MAG: alpha/beta hydrolase [Desulfobacteraceae bacterium]|jgi:pimeloyl-ACP methyl ester carboxylesterase